MGDKYIQFGHFALPFFAIDEKPVGLMTAHPISATARVKSHSSSGLSTMTYTALLEEILIENHLHFTFFHFGGKPDHTN